MANAAKNVMLAESWNEDIDPTGWWISEKLDGVRAYWNGKHFFSRLGHMYHAPKWFTKDLPDVPLDGELWCGRGLFQKCVGIVKKHHNAPDSDWKFITYLIFDAPSHDGKYEERVAWLREHIQVEKESTYAAVVGIKKCQGKDHLTKLLDEIIEVGGEGLMLRKPGSSYENGRSSSLLKVKRFYDEEAKVIGYKKGDGRLAGMMGALECELTNGVKVTIGTGFNDAQRKNPPKKGTVITFKYQELSDAGHPRFPVFLRKREDLTWDEVVELAKTKTPFSCKAKPKRELKKQHTILFSTVPSRDQSTGKKVVTDDDLFDDDEEDVADKKKGKVGGKPVCKYGASCYQTNPTHLAKFHHPPAAKDDNAATSSKKTPCKWGALCYLTNKQHLEKYSHPPKNAAAPAAEEHKGKAKDEDEEPTDRADDDDLIVDEDPRLDSDEETVAISRKEWQSMQSLLKDMAAKVASLSGSGLKRSAEDRPSSPGASEPSSKKARN